MIFPATAEPSFRTSSTYTRTTPEKLTPTPTLRLFSYSYDVREIHPQALLRPMPNREEAWKLLCEYTQSENLRKHALAVEACVRAYARKFGGDEALWSVTALLHDFDYEKFPNAPDHPLEGSKILRARGYPEELVQAILSHADYMNVPREMPLQIVATRAARGNRIRQTR